MMGDGGGSCRMLARASVLGSVQFVAIIRCSQWLSPSCYIAIGNGMATDGASTPDGMQADSDAGVTSEAPTFGGRI